MIGSTGVVARRWTQRTIPLAPGQCGRSGRYCGSASTLPGRRELDGDQFQPVDRLAELLERRYALLAEFQPDHALRALHAIGLGAPQVEVGHHRTVPDELATHGGRLAAVHDLGSGTAAEILLPSGPGQRIEVRGNSIVDHMGAHRNGELPPAL